MKFLLCLFLCAAVKATVDHGDGTKKEDLEPGVGLTGDIVAKTSTPGAPRVPEGATGKSMGPATPVGNATAPDVAKTPVTSVIWRWRYVLSGSLALTVFIVIGRLMMCRGCHKHRTRKGYSPVVSHGIIPEKFLKNPRGKLPEDFLKSDDEEEEVFDRFIVPPFEIA